MTIPPLSDRAKELLGSVKPLRDPTLDVEQSLASVHERIAAGTPPPDGAAGSGAMVKLVAGTLGLAATVALVVWSQLGEPTAVVSPSLPPAPPASSPVAEAVAPPAPVAPMAPEPRAATEPLTAAAPSPSEVGPEPPPTSRPRRSSSARRTTAPDAGVDALTAELELIDRARAQLRARRFDAALTTLERHAQRFASGQLVDEREVMLIEALCGIGRTGPARKRAAAFLAAQPQSPFVHRVRASCAGSG